MASADIPEEMWATAFDPGLVRERMRWVMEYDLMAELAKGLHPSEDAANTVQGQDGDAPPQVQVVC